MKLELENISKNESDYILRCLKDNGFVKVWLDPQRLKSAHDAIKKNLLVPDPKRITAGYSQGLENVLDQSSIDYFQYIANRLCSYEFTKKYLWFPRVAGVDTLWSFFSQDIDVKALTHAHLWHRDLDDPMGPQLKLMIPLMDTNVSNGRFSACSKSICELQTELQDERITAERISDNAYLQSDIVRVTDETMREHFGNMIVDFNTSIGEAILIDTNSCYHKGGLILESGCERFLVQLTVGSPSHSWLASNKKIQRFIKFRKTIISWGWRYKDSFDVMKRRKILLAKLADRA